MAEELKDLINKINEEGIRAAKQEGARIEEEAKKRAQGIIAIANSQSKEILDMAKQKTEKMEENAKASIKQGGRDILIALRKEINAMLDKLITSHVHKALAAEELTKIINQLIKEAVVKDKTDIVILLKKEDLDKLEKSFLDELKNLAKKGITLRVSEDIQGGFLISYDGARSYYDFTDKALSEYLSSYIKPKLGQMLNGAAL